MADHGLITRRAALVGAIASTAALAVPFALAIEPRATSLRDLIQIHKAAFLAHDDACGEWTQLESKLPWVEVQYGTSNGVPIYARSRRQLVEQMDICLSVAKNFGPASIENTKNLWFGLLKEWDNLAADRVRLNHELGVDRAALRQNKTMEAEAAARLAIVLHRPRDADEEALKRKYWQESPPFRDGWCEQEEDFVEAVYEALCVAERTRI